MPGAVRLQLDAAIFAHRQSHQERHYDLLRDDPRFAPWIGTHLGWRGEKRLDRAIGALERNQPKKAARARRASAARPCEGQGESSEAENTVHAADPAMSPVAPRGGVGAIRFSELQDTLRFQRVTVQRAVDACLNEFDEITDLARLLKLHREQRAILSQSADLAKRFHANLNSEAFLQRIFSRLASEHPDEPERARALCADIEAIFEECGGPGPTGAGQ